MSVKALEYLEDWIEKNVSEEHRHGDRSMATELAQRCASDAASKGVDLDELTPEQGNVETIIYEAMQYDKDLEIEYWKNFEGTRYLNLAQI
jgi:hypothetical protein